MLLAALLLATLAAPALEARKNDREQPMNVESDASSGSLDDDGTLTLTGNVRITQGSLTIEAAKATVEQRGGEMNRIVLDGSPVRMNQLNDRGEPISSEAARVTYTPGDEIVLLSGDASVTQPRGVLRAQTIRYNMDTGNIDSGGDGGRVNMTIQPKARAAAD